MRYPGFGSDPRVIRFVGDPQGLYITEDEVRQQIVQTHSNDPAPLRIIEERSTSRRIGQYKLGAFDACGVNGPDLKPSPAAWRQGHGIEAWRELIDTSSRRTDYHIAQGTPNVDNRASFAMQEVAGMRRVGSGVFEFPMEDHDWTERVPYCVYQIRRAAWKSRTSDSTSDGSRNLALDIRRGPRYTALR